MQLTPQILTELQNRLKIGNRRGVHLNAVPGNSKYKLDLKRFSLLEKGLPEKFIETLLSKQQLSFKINQRRINTDLNMLKEYEHKELVKLTRTFDNLIFQTEAIESEKGVNTLAFGFPILVRRDLKDDKLTVAPIFIWSLNAKNLKDKTWLITRNEDDPVYLNEVLINHLIADSNIEIDKVTNDDLEDGFLTKEKLIEICCEIIKTINGHVPDDMSAVLTQKLSNVSAIGAKKHYEDMPISSSNALIDFGGLFSIFEVQKQNIIGDYGNLMDLNGLEIAVDDIANFEFQSISSVETDPSQQSILNALKSTSHIVIQGPPGTGKSQTLSAVLINALENKKRTLVVCEKRTALDVLHQSLLEKGLTSHSILIKDIIHDRRKVVDSVRDRLAFLRPSFYNLHGAQNSLNQLISKIQNLISSINKKHQKLDEKLLGNKNWTDVVGALIREKKELGSEELLKLDKLIFQFNESEFNQLLDIISTGQKLYNKYKVHEPKSWLNHSQISGNNPYEIQEKINADFSDYLKKLAKIKEIYSNCRKEYMEDRRQDFQDDCEEIDEIITHILSKEKEFEELLSTSKMEYSQARQLEIDEQYAPISDRLKAIKDVFDRYSEHTVLTNPSKVNSILFKLLTKVSNNRKKIFDDHHLMMQSFDELDNLLALSKDFNSSTIETVENNNQIKYNQINDFVKEVYEEAPNRISSEFSGFKFDKLLEQNIDLKSFNAEYRANNQKSSTPFELKRGLIIGYFANFVKELEILFEKLDLSVRVSNDIKEKWSFKGSYKEGLIKIDELQKQLAKLKLDILPIAKNEFDRHDWLYDTTFIKSIPSLIELNKNADEIIAKISADNWPKKRINTSSFKNLVDSVENLAFLKETYFNDPDEPFLIEFDWFVFFNRLTSAQKSIINELKTKQDWKRHFVVYYLDTLLLKNAHTDLPKNDDDYHEYLSVSNNLEKTQLSFIQEFWHNQQIRASEKFKAKNNDLSVENLFNKRKSNKHNRLSLRQIVKFDTELFTTFFPIILTTPDVASNLFQGMNDYFDIVMFDEASQLRIEDNLPALFKGKQIVIAGDEHQMPPSNYFSKIFEGSIEDDSDFEDDEVITLDKSNIVLSCESLLELGIELNFKKQYLDFHYRSKHPYLIDFSNYAFYNQRLKPLPNTSSYIPIKFVNVNGTYHDHTNDDEANTVLSIIEHNIKRKANGEYPTVGIATFNVAQRDHIKSKIVETINSSQNEELINKLTELDQNGMFIKNLENIQGDERDVIIISTTYGNTKDNSFAQRFGPINFEKGYKLLNVLITRAKYKIYLCTSIPEKFYLDYKSFLVTEQANNKKAVFYAYLAYCRAVSDGDNDARIAVLNSLSENSSRHAESTFFREIEHESPFEEEVYERLSKVIDPLKLHTQYKVSEFRIDIVYDPQVEGYPKIAIECDGADYHSSPEAYLYDCHRQKILEGHGFVFHRIWSTNWWRNPDKETTQLLNFIENIEKQFEERNQNSTELEEVFLHDVVIKSHKTEIQTNSINDLFDNYVDDRFKVKLGSVVKIKYLQDDKELVIQITSDTSIIKDSERIQKINLKSPMAIALMGREKGEKVKIPAGDLIVEIISVVNESI
jgi:superfamily I DNA and/or RNA helicase/very-short-patch-repair endonuclease